MASRRIAAAFELKSGKLCTIENDGIVTFETMVRGVAGKYEHVRVVGMDRSNEAVRVVMEAGGIAEIPTKSITVIKDITQEKTGFPCVTYK
ncbi:MAG: hypothetical protein NC548_40215 [Lachnospiraceae bacterium]|nr:hypothetical protein [Lachnospiraceae bacterium]